MTTTLFINYYIDKNSERQKELDGCLLENLKAFDKVVIVADGAAFDVLNQIYVHNTKIVPVIMDERPTFKDFFDLTALFSLPENLNVIANSDIIVPRETLTKAEAYFTSNRLNCLALTRWDMTDG